MLPLKMNDFYSATHRRAGMIPFSALLGQCLSNGFSLSDQAKGLAYDTFLH